MSVWVTLVWVVLSGEGAWLGPWSGTVGCCESGVFVYIVDPGICIVIIIIIIV